MMPNCGFHWKMHLKNYVLYYKSESHKRLRIVIVCLMSFFPKINNNGVKRIWKENILFQNMHYFLKVITVG